MKSNVGMFYAVAAYTWWGIIPIFWKQLAHVSPMEIVLHRMVWACLFVTVLIIVMKQWPAFSSLFKQPVLLLRMFVAALLMSANWALFIWAVNSAQIVEASMGYFMNPLISVLFAVVFFKERLRTSQGVAIMIALAGVLMLVLAHGELPVVALSLATTFSLYSVIKKTVAVPATHGMALETMFMMVPAAVVLLYFAQTGQGVFGKDSATDGLLLLAGLFTLVPLTLFAAAAKKISMMALGMSQYIGPFLQLGIGVLIYNEPFDTGRLLAFSLVWLALVIYSLDQLNHRRKVRRARVHG